MCALNDSHTHRSPQRPPSTSYTWEYKPRNPYNHFQVSRAETSTLPAAVSLPTFALNLNTVQPLDTRFWLSFSLQTSLPQTPPCIWSRMRLCTVCVVGEMINRLLQSWLQPAVQKWNVATSLWRNSKFPHSLPLLPVPLQLPRKLSELTGPPFCSQCSLCSCTHKAQTAILGSLCSRVSPFLPHSLPEVVHVALLWSHSVAACVCVCVSIGMTVCAFISICVCVCVFVFAGRFMCAPV